ncbi:MAG: DUF1080 domain-containing protein [Verrucomicrobiota bacterium]
MSYSSPLVVSLQEVRLAFFALSLFWLPASAQLHAQGKQVEQGFVDLFNGKDLSGWYNVNGAPETWSVKDGRIHCTGKPICALRTERQYENFILELEWRHLKPKGNAGVFIWSSEVAARGQPFLRAIEVQVLENSYGNTDTHTTHGDIFPIHGSTMKPHGPHRGQRSFPTERRAKDSPQWNHYRVECNDGVLRLQVNGREVSGGSECNWRKGYLALESEGSPVEFRNVRIKELPATGAPKEMSAPLAKGFRSLYNGIDFRGWKLPSGSREHWKAEDWRIVYDGKSTADDKNLWTEESFEDFELIVDWRLPKKSLGKKKHPKLLASGEYEKDAQGKALQIEIEDHGDSGIFLRGSSKAQVNIWSWPNGSGEVWGYRTDARTSAEQKARLTPKENADEDFGKWNRFVITMKGEKLTVELNGKMVIEDALLPGVPSSGPIGLQHHGDEVEFANIYIRKL